MSKARMCVGLAACALVFATLADRVVFKSGAMLTGKVVRMAGGDITFASDDVGEVTIKKDKVAQLVTDKPNTILYTDKTTEEAVVGITNGQFTVAGKGVDVDKVKAVNPEVEKWHGSVNLSASSARGNTRSETVTLLADASRKWEMDRLNANFGYYFAQSGNKDKDKEKTEDRLILTAQEDHFWSTKVYSYVNGRYERDGINDLDYRYHLGTGLGYQWFDGDVLESTGKWTFNQEAGVTYVKDKYEHTADDDHCTFRYAHHLAWVPRWVDKLAFSHNLEYLPDTDDWEETYLLNADVGFTYALAASWQLMGKAEWEYNSNPPTSTKSSDFRYVLGLGYKW